MRVLTQAGTGSTSLPLPQRLVAGNRHGIREVQAAYFRAGRQAETALNGAVEDFVRQPLGLAPKNQHIALLELRVEVRSRRFFVKYQCRSTGNCSQSDSLPVIHHFPLQMLPVVHPGTTSNWNEQ